MKDQNSVLVSVTYGRAWFARAGRGRNAHFATSHDSPGSAAKRAAAKYFRLDESNVTRWEDIIIREEGPFGAAPNGTIYRATLPPQSEPTPDAALEPLRLVPVLKEGAR